MIRIVTKVFLKVPLIIATAMALVIAGQRNVMEQKKTVPLLGKDGPFGSTLSSSSQEERAKGNERVIPIRISEVAGSQSIFAMRDPNPQTFSGALSGTDRDLNLFLKGEEWGALFFEVLTCPPTSNTPRLPNEDREEEEDKYRVKFRQAIPDYPMLGRMWDIFIYVSFEPEEIEQLRAECLRVQSATSNKKALAGLTKLLSACDEASKHGSGLLFVPD